MWFNWPSFLCSKQGMFLLLNLGNGQLSLKFYWLVFMFIIFFIVSFLRDGHLRHQKRQNIFQVMVTIVFTFKGIRIQRYWQTSYKKMRLLDILKKNSSIHKRPYILTWTCRCICYRWRFRVTQHLLNELSGKWSVLETHIPPFYASCHSFNGIQIMPSYSVLYHAGYLILTRISVSILVYCIWFCFMMVYFCFTFLLDSLGFNAL